MNFKLATEAHIELAIAQTKAEEKYNITAIIKIHNVDRSTLYRRYKGQSAPRASAYKDTHQCLNKEQEESLIDQINNLTQRSLCLLQVA